MNYCIRLIFALLISGCTLGAPTSALADCAEPGGCPLQPPPEPPRVPHQRDRDPATLVGSSEYVFAGSAAEIEKVRSLLSDRGAVTLRQKRLGSLGASMLVVDPNGLSLESMRSLLATHRAKVTMDRNSTYKTAAATDGYAAQMVGMTAQYGGKNCVLVRHITVGLIDGPVDPQSPALKGVALHSRSFLSDQDTPGGTTHATDLAILIAAPSKGGLSVGLARGASLVSAVAFMRDPGGDTARMDGVAEALDWLTGQDVDIINMSLTGPPNDSLAYVLGLVAQAGPVMLAATGNDGAQSVSYPASDPNVIAVTAIDAAKRLYRQANKGAEVDFAAPGVDLLVDDGNGTRHLSGTSYATAVGTALVSHLLAGGTKGLSEVKAELQRTAEDLGPAGRDDGFGWGMIRLGGCKNY